MGAPSDTQIIVPPLSQLFEAKTYSGFELQSSADRKVSSNVDLLNNSGLRWIKRRGGGGNHILIESSMRANNLPLLSTNTTDGPFPNGSISTVAPLADGFSVTIEEDVGSSVGTYVAWSFREAPKFFDAVRYSGSGISQVIPHSLGVAPGMIVTKMINGSGDWNVYHRNSGLDSGNGSDGVLTLNTTSGSLIDDGRYWGVPGEGPVSPDASSFTVGYGNAQGAGEYLALLFAHSDDPDSYVRCGWFETNSGGAGQLNLGFKANFLLVKRKDNDGDWMIFDGARGLDTTSTFEYLKANSPDRNSQTNDVVISPGDTTTDFSYPAYGASRYIYMAIRFPDS
jgi:hypothetical protein